MLDDLKCITEFCIHPNSLRNIKEGVTNFPLNKNSLIVSLMIDEEHKEDTDNSHLTKIDFPEVNTSKNKLESFKPEKIVASLVRETCLDEAIAWKLIEVLTRRLIAGNVKILTSPEIREMMCGILVEFGYEYERFRYTRLGLPYYDFREIEESDLSEQEKMEKVYYQLRYEYEEITKILNILNKAIIDSKLEDISK